MVKTATSQNGDTETATEIAIVKMATNPNNTYSSSDAYIIDHRLYTSAIWHATNMLYEKKYNIPSRAMPDVSAKEIWAHDILLTNDCTAKTAVQLKFSQKFTKRSVVDESKFIRLLWNCSRFGLSPFWPYPVCTITTNSTKPFTCYELTFWQAD